MAAQSRAEGEITDDALSLNILLRTDPGNNRVETSDEREVQDAFEASALETA